MAAITHVPQKKERHSDTMINKITAFVVLFSIYYFLYFKQNDEERNVYLYALILLIAVSYLIGKLYTFVLFRISPKCKGKILVTNEYETSFQELESGLHKCKVEFNSPINGGSIIIETELKVLSINKEYDIIFNSRDPHKSKVFIKPSLQDLSFVLILCVIEILLLLNEHFKFFGFS